MHKVRKGDISVNYVVARLLEEGLDISVPISENSRYDIIVDNGRRLLKIQVKSIYWDKSNNCYCANAYSVNRKGEGNTYVRNPYTKEDCDFIITFNVDTKQFFIFPIEDITVSLLMFKEKERGMKTLIYENRYDLLH